MIYTVIGCFDLDDELEIALCEDRDEVQARIFAACQMRNLDIDLIDLNDYFMVIKGEVAFEKLKFIQEPFLLIGEDD